MPGQWWLLHAASARRLCCWLHLGASVLSPLLLPPLPPHRRALLDGVIRLSCRIDVQQDVRRMLGHVPPESHEAYRWAGLA